MAGGAQIDLETPEPINVNTPTLRFKIKRGTFKDRYPTTKQEANHGGYLFFNCNTTDGVTPQQADSMIGGPASPPPWLGGSLDGDLSAALAGGEILEIPFGTLSPARTPGRRVAYLSANGGVVAECEFDVSA